MNTFAKYATAAAVAGALALPATPSMAAHGRNAAAIGFGAGALVGAAAAGAFAPHYYGSDYAYGPGYAYDPGYAYEPDYAYEPAPAPVYAAPGYGAYAYEPAPAYSYAPRGYRSSGDRLEHACMRSPASVNYVPCTNSP